MKDNHELRQTWRTDPTLFLSLHRIFRFTIDACASKKDALLPRYWTKEQDAALQSWKGETVFCNPPFKGVAPIIAKATEAELTVMVFMLNALTACYFHKTPADYILVPPKRMQFIPPCGLKTSNGTPSFGTCLLVWGEVSEAQERELNGDWLIYATTTWIH